MLEESNVTTTLVVVGAGGTGAAGAFTTTVASPVFDSTLARMTAFPGAIAVTNPEMDTVATAVLRELHPTNRPVSMLPPASRAIAVP
jgi:hypothetical protein